MSLGTILLQSHGGEVAIEIGSNEELLIDEAARDILDYDMLMSSMGEPTSQAGNFLLDYEKDKITALLKLLPTPRDAHKFTVLCIENAMPFVKPFLPVLGSPINASGDMVRYSRVVDIARKLRLNVFGVASVDSLNYLINKIDKLLGFPLGKESSKSILLALEYTARGMIVLVNHGKLDLPISGDPSSTRRALSSISGAVGRETVARYCENLQRSGRWYEYAGQKPLSDFYSDAKDAERRQQFEKLVAYVQECQRGTP